MTNTTRRLSLSRISLLAAVVPLTVSGQPRNPGGVTQTSAPISNVRYEVTARSAEARTKKIHVRMTFGVEGAEPVLLSLPAWTPGAYEISNFARWVSSFEPTAEGKPLKWDKADPDTWRIQTGSAKSLAVDFDVAADSLDNAMSWARNDFVFFNGTTLFLYPEGRSLDFAATVTVRTEPNWIIATGMTAGTAPRTFTAANFHDLVDMPFFIGRFDLDSAVVSGITVRLATYPAGFLSGRFRSQVWDGLKKMIPPQVAVFGEAPFRNYSVMQIADSSYGGASGLEHQNSHVDVVSPFALGNPVLLSLYAHEIFHAWNVKRLRPAALYPYRYDQPQPTELLWVSEGITDYYADLSEVRGGIIDSAQFMALTEGKINEVKEARPIAVEDASVSTWIHPADETSAIYYPKGSIAGFMLDIMIRDASDNARSLDDVMRSLYRSTFKAGKGFTSEDFWAAATMAAGGKSFTDFHARYIDGREPYPWETVLPLAGMKLITDSLRFPVLGVVTLIDSSGIRVSGVDESGPAYEAGVRVGDVLLGVGDITVEDQEFGEKFRAKYVQEGGSLPLRIRRDGRPLTLSGKVRLRTTTRFRIAADPGAAGKALRVRNGILRGSATTR